MLRAFMVKLVLLVGIALFCGCAEKSSQLSLGPRPADYFGKRADQKKTVDEMRAWLQELDAKDVETLQETGEVALSGNDLKGAQAARVKSLEESVAKSREKSLEKARAKGLELPEPGSVRKVTFRRLAPGQYEATINYSIGFSHFPISDPLPSKQR